MKMKCFSQEKMLKTHKVKTKPDFLVKIKNYLPPGRVEGNCTAYQGMCVQIVSLVSDSQSNFSVQYLHPY